MGFKGEQLPESDRRWPQSSVREDGENDGTRFVNFLNPEPWHLSSNVESCIESW
jgi:hypothetical protein